MKAIQIDAYGDGGELRLKEIQKPTPAADEVLVKVYASGVNPIDYKVRAGALKERIPYDLPLTPGWDFSGVAESCGADVTQFNTGDAVYGRPDLSRNGTYAEYLVVKAAEISFKPNSIDHVHAAAVPLAGLTAWQGLFVHGHLQSGQRVAIQGAAGGVGTFAVQLAHWKGAHVIAIASAKHTSYLNGLGADEVVDYKQPNFLDHIEPVDVLFDFVGGESQKNACRIIKKGGVLVSIVGIADQNLLDESGIRGAAYMAQSVPEELAQLARLIDEGKLTVEVTKALPLHAAAEAQQLLEDGHMQGKIVLDVAAADS